MHQPLSKEPLMHHFYCTTHRLNVPRTSPHAVRGLPATVTPASRVKAALVAVLSWLLALRPTLAMALGRLVTRLWPGFGRA